MIGISKETIKNIPCLHVVDRKYASQACPAVIYYHGFTSAKEQNLPIAHMLAEKGFRVLLPEALHHGEREEGLSDKERQLAFFEIVLQNLKELPVLHDYLKEKRFLRNDSFGVAGTSMGGITTSAALVKYPWINAAAVMMGTPKLQTYADILLQSVAKDGNLPITNEEKDNLFETLAKVDLSQHTDALKERPLMFWHGDKDKVVPYQHSYDFYQEVKNDYKQREHIQFIGEKGREHKVSIPAMHHAAEWFKQHLL